MRTLWALFGMVVVLSVGIAAYFLLVGRVALGVKQSSCDDARACKSDENCCAYWDGTFCRKGKLDSSGNCSSGKLLLPWILFGVAGFFLFFSIGMLFVPAAHSEPVVVEY